MGIEMVPRVFPESPLTGAAFGGQQVKLVPQRTVLLVLSFMTNFQHLTMSSELYERPTGKVALPGQTTRTVLDREDEVYSSGAS